MPCTGWKSYLKQMVCNTMIAKNRTVPTTHREVFTTSEDGQDKVRIDIYQGEGGFVADNVLVGTLELSGIPPSPKGVPKIEVTFDIDANNIVHVSARDIGTGNERTVAVRSPYGLNSSQIKAMRRKLEMWLCERQNRPIADRLLHDIEGILQDGIDVLNHDEITELRKGYDWIISLKNQRVRPEDLGDAVSLTRAQFEQAQAKVKRYAIVTEEIDQLIELLPKH